MTRKEIQSSGLRRARQVLKAVGMESQLTEGFDDPWTLAEWVDEVVMDITFSVDNLYLKVFRDVVSGQVSYDLPMLRDVDEATVTNADGNVQHLIIVDPARMLAFDPTWHTEDNAGPPLYLVVLGDQVEPWPTPNFNVTSGLKMYGVGTISKDDWGIDDECPIINRFHLTVANGLALHIASSATGTPPFQGLKREYTRFRGFYQGENHELTEARRVRTGSVGGRVSFPSDGNPLNL